MKRWLALLPILCLCGCAAWPHPIEPPKPITVTTTAPTAVTTAATTTTITSTTTTAVTTVATSPTTVPKGTVPPHLCGEWQVKDWYLSPTAREDGKMTIYADGRYLIRLNIGYSFAGKTTVYEENGITYFADFPKKDAVSELRENDAAVILITKNWAAGLPYVYREK